MIGALTPHYLPVALLPSKGPRMLSVACCGECGNAVGSIRVRVCVRKDCGLADSFAGRRMIPLVEIRTPAAAYIFWPIHKRRKNMRRHERRPDQLAKAS